MLNKRFEFCNRYLAICLARTPLQNGGVRYSQRVEYQRSETQ